MPGEQRDEFHRALAVVKRRDQRLDDADGAVVGAGIAPGFEFVRLVHVPVAEFGGFVLIEPVVNAQRDLIALERVGEVEIGGRVVGGIAAEDHQQIDFARAHVGDEVLDRLGLVDRVGVDGIGVEDGCADVAELVIDGVGQGVDARRLMIADDYQTCSLMTSKLLLDSGHELVLTFGKAGVLTSHFAQGMPPFN